MLDIFLFDCYSKFRKFPEYLIKLDILTLILIHIFNKHPPTTTTTTPTTTMTKTIHPPESSLFMEHARLSRHPPLWLNPLQVSPPPPPLSPFLPQLISSPHIFIHSPFPPSPPSPLLHLSYTEIKDCIAHPTTLSSHPPLQRPHQLFLTILRHPTSRVISEFLWWRGLCGGKRRGGKRKHPTWSEGLCDVVLEEKSLGKEVWRGREFYLYFIIISLYLFIYYSIYKLENNISPNQPKPTIKLYKIHKKMTHNTNSPSTSSPLGSDTPTTPP